jgi:hypothetical protein
MSSGSASQSGSSLSTEASVSEIVSPENARSPLSISYRTQPKDQTSARLSTGRPRACSGDMYAAVPNSMPSTVPREVIVGDSEALLPPDAGSG